MNDTPASDGQTSHLRFLKWLVMTLTTTMIVGLIVLIGLIVMRFSATPTAALPDQIALPAGTSASAFTRGPDWLAVVTTDNRILIYDLDGETLLQEIEVLPAE